MCIIQLIPKCTCGEKAQGVVWMTRKCVAKSDHNLESYSPTSHSVATALCIILHTHKISCLVVTGISTIMLFYLQWMDYKATFKKSATSVMLMK